MNDLDTEQKATSNGHAPAVITRTSDEELLNWCREIHENAATRRRTQAHEEHWDDWRRQFWGENLWPDAMPSYKPPIVINTLQTRILQEVSDLTEQPITVYVSKDPSTGQRDLDVERAIQAFWQRNNVDYQIMLAVLNATYLPCGFFGVFWNSWRNNGAGDVEMRSLEPDGIYPDPDAVDDQHPDDWRYVEKVDVLDLLTIRQNWGTAADGIKPDDEYSIKQQSSGVWNKVRKFLGGSGTYTGPLYGSGYGVPSGYVKAQAAVHSLWVYDDEMEEWLDELTDPQTGAPMLKTKLRKKYPNGRLIQWASNAVLYDGPNPYHGRFPIKRVSLQLCPGQYWPPNSIVGSVIEIYKAANKADSGVVENGLRLNAGKVIADANSGIKKGRFTNSPAEVLLKTPGSEVKIQYPPPMPADMVQMGRTLRAYADEVLGFPPGRVGMGDNGNVAPELVETEIGQSQGLSRLRGRLLHMAVESATQMILERMNQFYLTPRMIPYISGSQWQPVRWDPTTRAKPEAYSAYLDPASFEVRSKTMMQRLYLTLAKMGKIPDKDLLEMLAIPNAEEIAQRNAQQLELLAKVEEAKHGKKVPV